MASFYFVVNKKWWYAILKYVHLFEKYAWRKHNCGMPRSLGPLALTPPPIPSLGNGAMLHKSEHEHEQSKVNLLFVCCQSGPNKACQKLQTACLHVYAAGRHGHENRILFPRYWNGERDFFSPQNIQFELHLDIINAPGV